MPLTYFNIFPYLNLSILLSSCHASVILRCMSLGDIPSGSQPNCQYQFPRNSKRMEHIWTYSRYDDVYHRNFPYQTSAALLLFFFLRDVQTPWTLQDLGCGWFTMTTRTLKVPLGTPWTWKLNSFFSRKNMKMFSSSVYQTGICSRVTSSNLLKFKPAAEANKKTSSDWFTA